MLAVAAIALLIPGISSIGVAMGDNNVVIAQILAVVLFLFFCFVTYMNTKTWRATHVTFLFLTFSATLAFIVYASLSLKTRKTWQELEKNLTQQAEKEKQTYQTLLYGSDEIPKPQKDWGVADIRPVLQRETLDRGRVWRGVTFVDAEAGPLNTATDGAEVTVKLSTRPPGLDVGAQFEPNHMKKGLILYAFKDKTPEAAAATNDLFYIYVGEFQADEVSDGAVTLKSTMHLSAFDQALVRGNEPWVLYERMPIDSHAAFASSEIPIDQVLRANHFVEPKQHPDVLANYKRDGGPAKADDPPECVFAKVRFLKDYTFKVDAAEARPTTSADTPSYDRNGQALDPRLRRGSDVTFKVGDEAELLLAGYTDPTTMLEEKGAEQLAEEGILEITEKIYRRPLNDYAFEFRYIYDRSNEIRDSLALVETELATVTAEEKLATANNDLVVSQLKLVKEDRAKVENEKAKITTYADALEASYRTARSELSRLYRENTALHDEIVSANERLTNEIDARGATPTSAE